MGKRLAWLVHPKDPDEDAHLVVGGGLSGSPTFSSSGWGGGHDKMVALAKLSVICYLAGEI